MPEKTLLVVEDNVDDAELLVHALQAAGVTEPVVVAKDGLAALDYLVGDGTPAAAPPALVVLDWKLPRLGGADVLARLRSDGRSRRTPVVVLSSSQAAEDLAEAYDRGANAYMHKSVDFDEFQAAVAAVAAFWMRVNINPPEAQP